MSWSGACLAAPNKRPLILTLASLELALGRHGDRHDAEGLNRLDALQVEGTQLQAQRTYLRAIGGRMSAWLGSAVPSAGGPGASDEVALRALLPLVDQVDKTEPREGRSSAARRSLRAPWA